MFQYLKEKSKYSVNAMCANIASTCFMISPNETIGDFFYTIHKHFVFKAHTARVKAQEALTK
jgi:hypothetical protein